MTENHLSDEPVVIDQQPLSFGPGLWEVVWQRKAYVVFGIVLGLVLGVLFYFMAPKTYESTAQIFVVKKQPDRPISASASTNPTAGYAQTPVEDFLETHRSILRSAVVVNKAIETEQLTQLSTFQDSTRPARDLVDALKVARDRDKTSNHLSNSQVLNISFRCRSADDCEKVLSALVDSYHDFLHQSSQGSNKEALDLITKARDLVQNDLDQKDREFVEFYKTSPVVWKTEQGSSLYMERLAALDAQRATRGVHLTELRAKYKAVEAAIEEGRPRAEVLGLLSAVSGNTRVVRGPMNQQKMPGLVMSEEHPTLTPTSATLEQELIQLQLQEGRLMEDYGPKHPTVQSIRERMHTIGHLLAPSTNPEGGSPQQRERNARASETIINLKRGLLRQELEEMEREAKSLDVLYEAEMEQARKALPTELQFQAMNRSVERSKDIYKNIMTRLREVNLISHYGGYDAQVITPPTEAEKVSPKSYIVFPLAALVGAILGLGLVYLAEHTDKTFRSPEDIRRRLGLPVMGVIPMLKSGSRTNAVAVAGSAALDRSLYAWNWPKSKEAEAYRGVRTALYFSTRGMGSKVIQVTSPNPGDGKSTLAANLAVSIAQSGKRVLLVDADMRRPTLDKLFGINNETGFAMVLGGMAELPDVIQESPIPCLSLLPSGIVPPNPAELLISPRLHEVLAWMRDHFEYIVIDTPPLLAVTDPGVVGPQVDGVLLTIRSTRTNRLEAKRAREVLHNLGANVIGVIVNAAELSQSSYGYGYYGDKAGYYGKDGEEGEASAGDRPRGMGSANAAGETNGVPSPKG